MKLLQALCFSLLFAFCISPLFAQSEYASKLYKEFKAKNSKEISFDNIQSLIKKIDSVDDMLWCYKNILVDVSDTKLKKELFVSYANMLELSSKYSEAANVWESAATINPNLTDFSCLLSSAICHVLVGNIDKASLLASAVYYSQSSEDEKNLALLILAIEKYSKGELDKAFSIASNYFESTDYRIYSIAISLASISAQTENEKAILESAKKIKKNYIDTSNQLLQLLLASNKADKVLVTKKADIVPDDNDVVFYQLGAFEKIDNANDLINKIAKLKIKAEIFQKNSNKVFIVYVSTKENDEELILKLKNAGYEAYRLSFDPRKK